MQVGVVKKRRFFCSTDEICSQNRLICRQVDICRCRRFQQIRHIACQSSHGLQALFIFSDLFRAHSMCGIPILAGNHRYLHYRKIFIQPVESRTCSAAAAVDNTCSGFIPEKFRSGEADPVKDRTEGTVGTGIIDRRTDDHAV